jgi:methylated-DNA-[protein]-cysteine S-methyltransferase
MNEPDEIVSRLRRSPVGSPGVGGLGGRTESNGQVPGNGGLQSLVASALARADVDGLVDVAWAIEETPIGPLTLAATPVGIVRVGFGTEEYVLSELAAEVSPRVVHLPSRLDDLRRQLDEYFAGRRRHFDVRLDRRLSHGYRRTVLEALSRVPYGETVSYKDLAERTGNPKASRAVGTAMATNPIPILVPCHRVLRSGGALGGYGGGVETKVWLLQLEGALLG